MGTLKFRNEQKSVDSLLCDRKFWNLSPNYQRGSDVFTISEKSYLIETMLDGYPIGGSIFLVEKETEDAYLFDVIDGKQRLETIFDFYDNKFKFRPKDKNKYSDINGLFFSNFPANIKKQLAIYQFTISILDKEFNDIEKIKDVFSRINSTVHKLNSQEMRNAQLTPIGVLIREFIKKEYPNEALSKKLCKTAKSRRLADEKMISNLLAESVINIGLGKKTPTPASTKSLYFEQNFDDEQLSAINKRLKKVIRTICDMVDEPFNSQYEFDGLFNALFTYDYSQTKLNENRQKIQSGINEIISKEMKDEDLIGGGTCHTHEEILRRTKKFENLLEPYRIDLDAKRYFTYAQRKEMWDNNEHKCSICGDKIEFFELMDLDHIIPYNQGGKTTLENAQITCVHCNRSKQDKI